MRTRPIYREGKLLAETPTGMLLTKTLGSTGEHDLWGGAAATAPSTLGDVLELASSSVQDSPAVAEVWTIEDAFAPANVFELEIEGVLYAAGALSGLTDLLDALDDGSKETWLVEITTTPDQGDFATVSVGATDYVLEMDTPPITDTPDGLAAAFATEMAADPIYDVTAVGSGGLLAIVAKVPNTNTADIAVSFDSGAATATKVVTHGPACTLFTGAIVGSDLVLTAATPGVAYSVSAESANITATNTLAGGAGTGVQSVLVTYIDTDGYQKQEVVVLDGTTAVETVGEASKLLHLQAYALGSGGAAAGNITCGVNGETAVATLAAGSSEIHRLMWAVPNQPGCKWTAVMVRGSNTSGTAATLRLRVTGGAGSRIAYATGVPANSSVTASLLDTPIEVGPGESITATLEGNGATVICELVGYSEGV